MKTLQDLSQSLHQLRAEAARAWGEDEHTSHWNDHLLTRCENCDGGPANVDYCWQAHLQHLVLADNGPGYLKDTVE